MEVHDELSVFGWMLKTALESWTLASDVSINWVDDGAGVYCVYFPIPGTACCSGLHFSLSPSLSLSGA